MRCYMASSLTAKMHVCVCVCARSEVAIRTGRILREPMPLSRGVPVKPIGTMMRSFPCAEEPQRCLQVQLGSNGTTQPPAAERRPRHSEQWPHRFLHPFFLLRCPPVSLRQGGSGLIGSRDALPLQATICTPSCKLKPFSTRLAALISATLRAAASFIPLTSVWTPRGETL